jgi:hypothetical protein
MVDLLQLIVRGGAARQAAERIIRPARNTLTLRSVVAAGVRQKPLEQEENMRRLTFILIAVVGLMMLGTSDAAVAAEKDKEVVITGTVVEAPVDATGKLAGIAIECDDQQYAVAQNAIAKKIAKKIGKKLDITGVVEDRDGKKILFPWTYQDAGAKPGKQPDA